MSKESFAEKANKLLEWNEKFKGDFDPKIEYPATKNSKVITSDAGHRTIVGRAYIIAKTMQQRSATKEEMERIIRYLLVTIDAHKHKLDYQKAFVDFGITELSRKYKCGLY